MDATHNMFEDMFGLAGPEMINQSLNPTPITCEEFEWNKELLVLTDHDNVCYFKSPQDEANMRHHYRTCKEHQK